MTCSSDREVVKVEAYRSYNSSVVAGGFQFVGYATKYDTIVRELFDLLGLPNVDIAVGAVVEDGAFASISLDCQRRFLQYSEPFFDRVEASASLDAVKVILLHEIGHHLRWHPLEQNVNPQAQEKEADWFSGFYAYRLGLDTINGKAALEKFTNLSETVTHPGRSERLERFRAGYKEAVRAYAPNPLLNQILIEEFYLPNNIIALERAIESSVQPRQLDEIDQSNFMQTLSLLSDETETIYSILGDLIISDEMGDLRYLDSDEKIGQLIGPSFGTPHEIIKLDYASYILQDDQIYAINFDGSRMRVGYKLTN